MSSESPLYARLAHALQQWGSRPVASVGALVLIVGAYAVFQAWHFVPGCREHPHAPTMRP